VEACCQGGVANARERRALYPLYQQEHGWWKRVVREAWLLGREEHCTSSTSRNTIGSSVVVPDDSVVVPLLSTSAAVRRCTQGVV
jgi:hypothetical protein